MINIQQWPDNKLKQLIAIAAQQAGFNTHDKDPASEYRLLLYSLANNYSTAAMSKQQLATVLQHFIDRGFQLKANRRRPANPPWLKKLLHIWFTMGQQGFIRNANFATLEAWAKANYPGEVTPPHKLDWMGAASRSLIEKLKRYHLREIAASTAHRLAAQQGAASAISTNALAVLADPDANYQQLSKAYQELAGTWVPQGDGHEQ